MSFLLAIFLSLMSFNVVAQNLHYFGSIKASETTIADNDIEYDGISNKITITPLTTAGFSFDASMNDKFQVLSQFIYSNNSNLTVDLLQLRYHVTTDLVTRVGRQRIPSNLHSENIQVQALLPWITAPREVYSRVKIYSFTGASLEKNLGNYFDLHLYGGDTKDKFITGEVEYETSANNLYGVRLNFQFRQFKAFVNAYKGEANLKVKTDIDAAVIGSPVPGTTIGLNQNYNIENINSISAGFQFNPRHYYLMSEFTLITSNSPTLERAEGIYFSVGKDFYEKWIPVITFSTDLDVVSSLTPSKTATYAFNLNYRLDNSNIIKAGIEHINYKSRTVSSTNFPGSTNAGVFTNASIEENFEIFSLMWAFVY